MRPLVIVKTGSTVPAVLERRGDFEEWIARDLAWPRERIEVVAVHEGEALPPQGEVAAVVVTGSSAMVSEREPWSERTAQWLPELVERGTPFLGICYGHQLLAHALDGEVGPNPNGREIGTVEVSVDAPGDALLGSLAARTAFHATHVESVLRLPRGARRLATTPLDPNHAFALGERAWCVQFHPEFDADVMRGYIDGRRDILRAEGLDPEALERATRECPEGPELLQRFGRLAAEHAGS